MDANDTFNGMWREPAPSLLSSGRGMRHYLSVNGMPPGMGVQPDMQSAADPAGGRTLADMLKRMGQPQPANPWPYGMAP